ncbi:MAG: hypothetical protein ABSE21_03065 [Bryobacteraceae bacterium]|jgi:Tol biopolymer transport system component
MPKGFGDDREPGSEPVSGGPDRSRSASTPNIAPAEGDAVTGEAVAAELERLLSSSVFRTSERLSRFLKFVVQQHLAGNAGQIKESVLAVEIFDRQPSYDSRVDSLVRVEARRVREKLEKYYADEGRDDPVIVTLPKGAYVPAFAVRPKDAPIATQPTPGAPPGRRRSVPLSIVVAATSVSILIMLALAYWTWSRGRSPAIPLRRLTSDSGLTFEPALSADGTLLAYSSDRSGSGDFDIWVQRTSGGLPHRLTDDPRDEIEPTFSPDGTLVAYRAEGPADGIYTVPSFGGTSTLLARGGYRPRFSPDGKLVAFWMGERTFRWGKIFVVPLAGGSPAQLVPQFLYAAYPIWSPDGRYILFVGCQSQAKDWDRVMADWDWWVVPAAGGQPVRTFARKAFEKQGLSPPESTLTYSRIVPYAWTSLDSIVFSAALGDKTNIWRIPISEPNGQVRGPAEQITFGTGREDHPTVAKDGTLAFAVLTYKSDVWSLPTNAETGEARGPLTKLTSSSANHRRPVVSRDGQRLVFTSNRNGNYDVWVKDLTTGTETALTTSRGDKSSPVLSPDGSTVAFTTSNSAKRPIFLVPFAGGTITQICADCGEPRTWLPDGRGLLYQWVSPSGTSAISELQPNGETRPLVQSRESALYSPSVSPDGKWIALLVRTPPSDHRVALVPLRNGVAAPPSEWVYVTESGPWINKPRWATTGNLIYYVSNRDGFECIWARQLNSATKQPFGEPKAIMHFHSVHNSLGSVYDAELSVAKGKLVFNLGEASGNIWLAPATN